MNADEKRLIAGIFALMFVMCAVAPVALAGSEAAPEITDAEGDASGGGYADPTGLSSFIDIVSGWFDSETDAAFNTNLKLKGLNPEPGTVLPAVFGTTYYIYFTVGEKSYVARCWGDFTAFPTDPTPIYTYTLLDADGNEIAALENGSVNVDTEIITMTVPKDKVGSPSAGSLLTQCYASTEATAWGEGAEEGLKMEDRAPDADFGTPYVFGGEGDGGGGGAVEYGVDVTAPSGKTAKPGDTVTYTFIVKNTGTANDTYTLTAKSQNNWNAQIVGGASVAISNGSSKNADVKVTVPSSAANGLTDVLTFNATSLGNSTKTKEVTVTTTVSTSGGNGGGGNGGGGANGNETNESAGVLNKLNEFAKGILGPVLESAGLGEALGPYTALILLILLLLLLLLILLLIILAARNVPFKMECADEAKDAKRGKETQYQITLTTKKGGKKGIPVLLEAVGVPDGWNANLDQTKVFVKRKDPQTVFLTVAPPADALDGTVAEISVIGRLAKVKKDEWKQKNKKRKITTRTKAVVPVPLIEIANVANVPQEAKKGDRVLTIIEIANQDEAEAQGVRCSLYVNDRIVHSEIASIPASSKMEIKKSWIADSDDNEIRVALE